MDVNGAVPRAPTRDATGPHSRPRTRVLFLNTSEHFGAVMSVHQQVLKHLDIDANQVFIATNEKGESASRFGEIQGVTVKEYGLGASFQHRSSLLQLAVPLFSSLRLMSSFLKVLRLIVREKIDIIYCASEPRAVAMSTLLSMLSGARLVVHVHQTDYRGPNRAIVTAGLRKAEAVITVSRFIASQVVQWGIRPSRVWPVWNAVDMDRFSPEVDGGEIRREFGIGPDTPLVVAVGRVNRQKGQRALLEALPLVKKQVPDVRALVVGWPDPTRLPSGKTYIQELGEICQQNGLDETVILADARPDVDKVFAAADVVVVPSQWDEPFGLVVVEAMASGKAVVGTEAGGIPEIITEDTGLLVPRGDTGAMAEAIIRLLRQPELRETMGRNARRRAQESFYEARPGREVAQVFATVMGIGDTAPVARPV